MADEGNQGVEICDFNGSELPLPIDLIESPEIFSSIVSLDTWKNALTPENRKHLEKFLPQLPTDYPHAQEENLRALFEGENFKFGNPIQDFHTKLKDGYFYPDVVKYKKLCQKAKKKEYKLQLQSYYRKLLQEIIVSRQEILDQVSRQGPNDPIRTRGKVLSESRSPLEQRAQSRFRKIIQECKQECEDQGISSDEEERFLPTGPFGSLGYPMPFPGHPAGIYGTHPGYHHSMIPSIPGMPYGYPSFPFSSHTPRSPLTPSNVTVTEKDFQQMLQKHKKRRACNEGHPELDTRFTALSDIVYRTNPSKRPSKTSVSSRTNNGPSTQVEMNKKKDKKAKLKRKLKQKLQQKQERSRKESSKKQDSRAGSSEPNVTANLPPPPTGSFSSFFSLLREIFYSMPDYKASLHKIEEQVKAWQGSQSVSMSTWSQEQSDWVKLVYSSLMYISGSSGVTPSTFVPLVDFKERPQQWKWIGAFRDSDEELSQLCQDWLKVKDQLSIKKATAEGGSTVNAPEARVKTDYVVRPSTSTEQDLFREQELKRYMNPHKAYSYYMHGFESVVGPVKGVFSKETNLNKAREHSLLVSNRPPFVTILTLVRDAAARLPNGEGTRAEVCELLKDSQFLNKDATEAQIHTVVSGALDRLHYEKDPCVKYDSNRKVWIYLHRNRTKEEFEKIHQANAAAARAKKMQKPRMPRQSKVKEENVASVAETVDPSAVQAVASPGTQAAPVPSKPLEMKKPGIKIKIAGNSISGNPKISVITSLTGPLDEIKPPQEAVEAEQDFPSTHQSESTEQIPQSQTGTKSKLNTGSLNSKLSIPAVQSSVPSPGLRHTSALNSQTSALNSASLLYQSPGDEPVDVVSETREESGSEGSVSSSNSENESSSGNESSSEEDDESADEPTGGKTKHTDLKLLRDEQDDVDSPQSTELSYKLQGQHGENSFSQPYSYTSLNASKEDNESDDEQEESGSSDGGEGSESEDSNED